MINRQNPVTVVLLLFSVVFLGPASSLCLANNTADDTQAKTSTAQLTIEGKFILSLVLENEKGRFTALGSREDASVYRSSRTRVRSIDTFIDMPAEGEAVSLAPGRYRVNNIKLLEPDKDLKYYCNNPISESIELKAGKTTTLKIGAPLRHVVKTGRQGGTLKLNYSLLGAAGENYRLVTESTARQPSAAEFKICKGEEELFSGSFRYG